MAPFPFGKLPSLNLCLLACSRGVDFGFLQCDSGVVDQMSALLGQKAKNLQNPCVCCTVKIPLAVEDLGGKG